MEAALILSARSSVATPIHAGPGLESHEISLFASTVLEDKARHPHAWQLECWTSWAGAAAQVVHRRASSTGAQQAFRRLAPEDEENNGAVQGCF